jgi:two-component system, cell cycle sensor histidine kinase and response regulator CckA
MKTPTGQISEMQRHETLDFQTRFQRMFDHIPAMVFSRQGKVTRLNATAEAVLGQPFAAVRGKTLTCAGFKVTGEDGSVVPLRAQPWQRACRNNARITEEMVGLIRPGGEQIWLQCVCTPFRHDGQGQAKEVIALLSDMTRYVCMRNQSQQTQKMEALGALTGGIAHDFNNILASILAAVQLPLLDASLPPPVQEALRDIENEVMRGAELTKQLLLFSKPSDMKRKTSVLNDRIRRIRHLLRHTVPKNIRIETHLAPNDMNVLIDPTQLDQIILNLCLNARDAMPRGGELILRTRLVSAKDVMPTPPRNGRYKVYARLDVADTGTGIAPELLPRIFDPFVTSKERDGGTGLGLSIVFRIVREYFGTIQADSKPGKGTTMTVHLPARKKRVATTPCLPSEPAPMAGFETVLLVDDEAITLKSTARFLERYGYRTLTARNGHEALDLFHRHKNDLHLVLIDCEMPEMGGPDCLARMLAEMPSLNAILLSGHPPSAWDPIEAGAKAFMQKPFDFNGLLAQIRRVLDTK